jgi:hypothetical protein
VARLHGPGRRPLPASSCDARPPLVGVGGLVGRQQGGRRKGAGSGWLGRWLGQSCGFEVVEEVKVECVLVEPIVLTSFGLFFLVRPG